MMEESEEREEKEERKEREYRASRKKREATSEKGEERRRVLFSLRGPPSRSDLNRPTKGNEVRPLMYSEKL